MEMKRAICQDSPVANNDNPFETLNIWTLILLIVMLRFALWRVVPHLGGPIISHFIHNRLFYGCLSAWLLWAKTRWGLSMTRLLGRSSNTRKWLPLVGTALILKMFAVVVSLLVYYVVAFIWPALARWSLEGYHPFGFVDAGTSLFWLYAAWVFLDLVMLAPLFEELVFRGVFLHTWAVRWGIKRAMVFSSLAFALLHQNMVFAFIIGFAMAILYVKTRSLVVPIACHAVGNGWTFAISLTNKVMPSAMYPTLASRYIFLIGVIVSVLFIPWVILLIRRHWQRKQWPLPYFPKETDE